MIELSVVVGITGALAAALMPSLVRAREAARLVQCASNLHQILVATSSYVAQWHAYPPNTSTIGAGAYWYDDDRIASYLPATRPPVPAGKPGGGAYVCPDDCLGAVFVSYGMNVWASSVVDPTIIAQVPASGRLWTPRVHEPSRMILFAEAYSGSICGYGWAAAPTVGGAAATTPVTTAGQRFGGAGGVVFNAKRFGKVTSELCFDRHRIPGTPGLGTQPRGRLNIAYADGHVAAKTDADLVSPKGVSTGDSCWSPADLPGD